ncbi:hypothetical protein BD311DRAFT_765147 [Dichomitus squalens]|uniref:Uncharacterized protein n=1 Tax=Dichomitus squalens TaxID=114155 RepID=A0A4Q9MD61_9APHY|nr:hypothetical protein BD311DRAFT_765147 [Dichomitus squalens]
MLHIDCGASLGGRACPGVRTGVSYVRLDCTVEKVLAQAQQREKEAQDKNVRLWKSFLDRLDRLATSTLAPRDIGRSQIWSGRAAVRERASRWPSESRDQTGKKVWGIRNWSWSWSWSRKLLLVLAITSTSWRGTPRTHAS